MNAKTRLRDNLLAPALSLMLACACAACGKQAAPVEDAAPASTEPVAAPEVPVAAAPIPASDTPATIPVETPAPPTASSAPVIGTAPSPKPKPMPIRNTTAKPTASPAAPIADAGTTPVHLTINALSRGKGVPSESREALKQIRALLEKKQASNSVVSLHQQRIGLEGESRLCVEFRNADEAKTAMTEIRAITAGVDLLDVAESACPPSKEYRP